MNEPAATVRRRRPEDVAPLGVELLAQQPLTRYPFRDPLPVPVADFLHADDALGAFTAEVDGRPVGHGCWIGPPAGHADAERMNAAAAAAYGCEVADLGWVSALFVGTAARGTGAGKALLDAVVADLLAAGRRPALEVLPLHEGAYGLYLRLGWTEVARVSPAWLREAAGPDAADVRVLVLPASA